jgi:hypothetical protein
MYCRAGTLQTNLVAHTHDGDRNDQVQSSINKTKISTSISNYVLKINQQKVFRFYTCKHIDIPDLYKVLERSFSNSINTTALKNNQQKVLFSIH